MADFELPSFSLGLDEVPSFSLGIDNILPPTPSSTVAQAGVSPRSEFHSDDPLHTMPGRSLKRLRRGPVGGAQNSTTCTPQVVSSAPESNAADDIEDFTSEDELPKSQTCSFRSFSALKPVKTPPVFETNPDIPSSSGSVSIKRTSLGSKEVKFQGIPIQPVSFPSASLYSPVQRTPGSGAASSSKGGGVPVYEFRDNQICIDIEDDDEREPFASEAPPTVSSPDSQVSRLLRRRFPHFSFVDDLEQENDGEPVYIDYRAQFGGSTSKKKPPVPRSRGSKQTEAKTTKKTTRARKRSKPTSESSQVLQENNGRSRKGYWVTEGYGKVYVTADGQRLQGKTAYLRYKQDSGQKVASKQKSQKTQRSQRKRKK